MFDGLTRGEARMLAFLLTEVGKDGERCSSIGYRLYEDDSPMRGRSSNPYTLPAGRMLTRLKKKGLAERVHRDNDVGHWRATKKAYKQAEQIGRPLIDLLFEGDDDA